MSAGEPTPGYLVWRLSMKWRVAVDRALAPLGLTHAHRDPADTRAIRLALTDRGREVVRPAITEVAVLLDRLMAPLGGRSDPRAKALVQDLATLLDTPLDQ
jgi:DNA-binding MarR family transcriptional regulator